MAIRTLSAADGITPRAVEIEWARAHAAEVRVPLARLLRIGVPVVITGASSDELDADLSPVVPPPERRRIRIGARSDTRDVLHVGRDLEPERARALLAALAAGTPVELCASPTTDEAWRIVEDGFVVEREHEIESLFAIANGFVGSRASLAEGSTLSSPATFVAGIYEDRRANVAALASIGDWAHLSANADGHPLRLDTGDIVEHRRTLDLAQGMVWREWTHRDPSGRITRIVGFRLASRAHPHLLIQSIWLRAENYSGTLAVDATVTAPAVAHTNRGYTVAVANFGELETPEALSALEDTSLSFDLPVRIGEAYRLDRVLAVATSRDAGAPGAVARTEIARVRDGGIAAAVDEHRSRWRDLWRTADVEIDGDPDAQRALRFAVYHLLSMGNPDDEHVSIGARALSGPGYAGHVFWDTEIYMLPFFTLAWPEAARALLMYRFHTLPAARAKAASHGYRGALYAWESADTGEEVAPRSVLAPDGELVPIRVAEEEQHISADVAYAVHRYWQATGDDRFMREAGAEILVETARFWASRVELGEDGAYHIRRVIGPDEYHESVDDDAYTNGMAKWNLETAAAWARHADEARQWREIGARMYTGLDPRTGILEQFRGYAALEDVDLRAFEPRTAPIDVLLGRERTARSKIIKQPDVLMLVLLLWDRFSPEVRAANFDYYEPRTAHGSSLSPSIHALLAARLGRPHLAQSYFRQAAEIDLGNNMSNAAGGVHAAALGGLWQAVVFGFAGLHATAKGPEIAPALPPHWKRLSLSIRWRDRTIAYDLPLRAAPRAQREIREKIG